MAINQRPEAGETERLEVLILKDQADKTLRDEAATSVEAELAATLQEADCRPPAATIIEAAPTADVTVWVSNGSRVAGPHAETVATGSRGEPGPWPANLLPRVAGYEILAELGRGAMGVVYKARAFRLNRICALKMMLSGSQADLPIAERFQGEAESLALLLHPNVVQIFSIGESDGIPYLELEYVGGGSLHQHLNGVPKPPEEAARLIAALARGVAAIHERGLVHRDLKPSNVLLAIDGTPKVADFGLVKVRTSEQTLTPTGSILGSPSYMAPEQAEGRGGEVGPAADVYGLGAILYELLTGRPPFRGATIHQTLCQVIANEPVLPSRLTPGLPRDIETICLKCLQKKPIDRYTTAVALAEDVRRFLAREPILARPVAVWERGVKWARRRPGPATLVAALATSLVGLLALGAWSYAEIERHLGVAENARAEAVAETYRARLSETSALEIARPAGWRDDAIRNIHLLAAMETPKRDKVELRTAAAALLGGIDVREVGRLKVGNSVRSLDFSRDSGSIATADYGGRLRIWDLETFQQVTVIDDPACNISQYAEDAPMPAVRYRPGGGGLLYATYGGCVEWYDPAHPGAKRRCFRGRTQPCSIDFDASGRRVVVSWTDGWVTLFDAETGLLRRSIVAPSDWHTNPVALSPDGLWIAAIGPEYRVQLYRVDSSEGPITLGRHNGHVRSLAFNPEGNLLASASLDETVKVWDLQKRTERLTLRGHTARLNGVAFHPNGNLLASASDDRTVRLWDARSGAALLVIRPKIDAVLAVSFSPDGDWLACGHNTVCLYSLTGLRERRRYPGHPHEIFGVAFHPREPHLVVSATATHVLNTFNVSLGTPIRRWLGDMAGISPLRSLAVGPKGRVVATGSATYTGVVLLNPDFPVRIWKIDDGSHVQSLKGHDHSVESLAFDAEGGRLASGGRDGTLIVWAMATGRKIFQARLGTKSVASVGFLDDGKRLIAGDDEGRIDIFDLQSGTSLNSAKLPGGLARFVIAPGSDRLLVGGDEGDISELSLPDLATIRRSEKAHDGPIPGLVVSPDGTLLFTGGHDSRVVVRDSRTLEALFALPPYDGSVYQLAINSDGSYLAVGGVEQRLDVWNLSMIAPALNRMGLSWSGRNSPRAGESPGRVAPRTAESVPSPIDRAWSLMSFGERVRGESGRASEAIDAYGRAIIMWEEMLREDPANAFLASELAVSLAALAYLEAESGRPDDASRSLTRAIKIVGPLHDTDPRVEFGRSRVFALASACEPDRRASHLDHALLALRRAIAGGYKDLRQIEENPDLDPLRGRDDFRVVIKVGSTRFGWPYLLSRGRSRSLQGRPSEAIADFVEARRLLLPLREAEPADPWLARNWAISTIDLAAVRPASADPRDELGMLADAAEMLELLAAKDPAACLALARAYALLAADRAGGDDADRSITALRRVIEAKAVDLDFLNRDPALRSLVPRADFQAALNDLAFPPDPFAP